MNQKGKLKYIIALIFAILVHFNLMAQCPVTAPKIVCIGDVGYFSISIPPGSTLVSADWNFGDGYTASGQNSGHLFAKSGSFMVKCKLSLTGGGFCQDSAKVDVLNLPKADFIFKQKDTCFNKNKICLTNKSTPANTRQPIVKNLVIWGDGNITNLNTGNCYTYKQKTPYKLTLEVTDSMGCKDLKSSVVNIVPGLDAKFTHTTDTTCGSTKICFINTTDTILNNTNKYTWQFNNSPRINSDYKTPQCLTFKKYTVLNVKYIVANGNGCRDSFSYAYQVAVDSLEKYKLNLNDTAFCYGAYSPVKFSITPANANNFKWQLNGKPFGFDYFQNEINPKKGNYPTGKYALKCTIIKGACQMVLDTFFRIKGPMAKIRIYNKVQCDGSQRVFFVDSTKVINYKKSSRLWVIDDKYGDSCSCYREKDINKFRNCNFSTDWYHKHDYKLSQNKNKVMFYVHDSITGCSDTIKENVNTKACSYDKKDTVCQGAFYLKNFPADKTPIKFSLDSGKTWTYFPGTINPLLKGTFSILLMFEKDKHRIINFGDDSVKILKDSLQYFYIYLKDQILIYTSPDPVFTYTISGDCQFKDVVVKLKSPKLFANETFMIFWGDGKSDTIKPKTNYTLDSLGHRYNKKNLLSTITVFREQYKGCVSMHQLAIDYGYNMFLDVTGGPCLRNNVCFKAGVYDLRYGKEWTNSNKYGNIKIETGEAKVFINDFSNPCYQFSTTGNKFIKLIATANDGCKDSLIEIITVNDIRAGVTESSKQFGCGEIKQLTDSSKLSSLSFDKITGYLWDFGSKTYAVTQKDPYYTFTKFGKYEVVHIVKSELGCTDSVKFMVIVEGPDPQFDIITDTIGCEPLVVKFRNNSKHCSQYYWRFGDAAQNTLLNNSANDVTFTYTTAGKYYIKLTGIDSFYSSATKSTYFCKNNFPDDTTKRSVTVLPFLKAAFNCPDTICVGQNITIKNISDARNTSMDWDLGDGMKKSVPFDPELQYTYTKSGTYKIKLKSTYIPQEGVPKCSDSAEKSITAKGILANFEFERKCESPLLNFKNLSVPENNTTQYFWDFGQPDLSQNISNEKNPQHDYGFNRGEFVVCLTLKDEFGCADSICETLLNDYKTELLIPNVFTPDLEDEKNDEYDIVMEGEEIYELSIFNRWGQLMYQSKEDCEPGTGTNWNGRINNTGQPCPEGTYFYIFDYKNCYGDLEKKRVTGAITLIR